MRYEERKGDTSLKKKEQARHHPRWVKRVIKSLSDEESVDPNSEWSQYATREYQSVSGHSLRTNPHQVIDRLSGDTFFVVREAR